MSRQWETQRTLFRSAGVTTCSPAKVNGVWPSNAAWLHRRSLRRYDRKPKRGASRRLYVLQSLFGVGPALAQRLLIRFGSVERVVTADEESLAQVRGIGLKKAARIRELVSG